MPDKNDFLYMDDGGKGVMPEMTPELEEKIEEIEKKIKDKYPDLIIV